MLKAVRQILALEWSRPYPDKETWRMEGTLGNYRRMIWGSSRVRMLILAWDMARGRA